MKVTNLYIEDGSKENAFFNAIKQSDNNSILEFEGDVNAITGKNEKGIDVPISPILYAIKINRLETIPALVEKGCTFEGYDRHGNSLLNQAILKKDPELIKILIDNGIDTGKPNRYRQSPLDLAVKGNDSNTIEALIAAGEKINIFHQKNALSSHSYEALETLVKHGGALTDEKNTTVLCAACYFGDPEALRRLSKIEELVKAERAPTVAMVAARCGDKAADIIPNLIANGASPHQTYYTTALQYAIRNDNLKAYNVLIKHHKERENTIVGRKKHTLAHYAILNGAEKVLPKILGKAPKLLSMKNSDGKLPRDVISDMKKYNNFTEGKVNRMQSLLEIGEKSKEQIMEKKGIQR